MVAPHAGAWIEIHRRPHRTNAAIVVAPHAGAWIEILPSCPWSRASSVAPHAGAWIEIGRRVRTMKCITVAPHAGAWIEMRIAYAIAVHVEGRAPRGRVD